MMNKPFITVLLGAVLFAMPLSAVAATFLSDTNVYFDQVINDNLYMAGGNPEVAGTVNGDLFVAGGNVRVSGPVTGDLAVGGGNVSITGKVNGDVRVFGGTILVDSEIGGEVISFGGDVTYGPKANIGRDMIVGSDNMKLDPATVVKGKKTIFQDEEGKREKNPPVTNAYLTGEYWIGLLMTILSYLVVAAVMMGAIPNVVRRYTRTALKDGIAFWKGMGFGLVLLISVPIAAFFLMCTGIGALLGGIILVLYLMYILVALVFAGFLFGGQMKKLIKKTDGDVDWVWGLGGVAVLPVLSSIPVVGWAIGLVFFLWSMGTLVAGDAAVYQQTK